MIAQLLGLLGGAGPTLRAWLGAGAVLVSSVVLALLRRDDRRAGRLEAEVRTAAARAKAAEQAQSATARVAAAQTATSGASREELVARLERGGL